MTTSATYTVTWLPRVGIGSWMETHYALDLEETLAIHPDVKSWAPYLDGEVLR